MLPYLAIHKQEQLVRFLTVVFWLGLLGLLALNLWYKYTLVSTYAPDLGGFERNVIWGIQQVMMGKPLYANPEAAPFAIVQYMPVYYYLVAFVGSVLKINALNAHSVYLLARAFNLLLCIGSAALLYATARKNFKVDQGIAVAASVFCFLLMDKFVLSGRPDALKVFFFQCVVFLFTRFDWKRKWQFYTGGIALCLLAFFTKQDGLVFSGIVPLVLMRQQAWKDVVVYIVAVLCLAGCFVVAIGFFQPHFLLNVAGGLQNGLSLSWFMHAFGGYFSLMAVLFGLGLVMAAEFAFETNFKLQVVAAAFVCSFFPQLLFALKYGSAPNYFLECMLVCGLMLCLWLQQRPIKNGFLYSHSPALMAVAVLAIWFYIPAMHWVTGVFMNEEGRLKRQYEAQKEIAARLRIPNLAGSVLVCIETQWEDHLTTLVADRSFMPNRDVTLQVENAHGKLNFGKAKADVEAGRVSAIVTEVGKKPTFLRLNYAAYKVDFEAQGYTVWRPAR